MDPADEFCSECFSALDVDELESQQCHRCYLDAEAVDREIDESNLEGCGIAN